jgi:Flp pilus assembly protein TadB
MIDLLMSSAGGGLLGGILSLGKLWGAYKEKKMLLSHEVKMAEEDRKNMAMEIDMAKVKGSIDLELQESEDDAKALTAVIKAEVDTKGASPWVQDLKASTRPILTYVLCVMAFVLVIFAMENPWTNEIVFLASTAVTFWFGDRPRRT